MSDLQNPYEYAIRDQIIDSLIGDYVDRSRKECEKYMRDYCHKHQIFDAKEIAEIIKRVWWYTAKEDITHLPLDMFEPII